MGEVVDLSKQKSKTITKGSSTPPIKEETLVQKLLRELYKYSNGYTDLMICTKDLNGEFQLYHTDLDLRDRSYVIQILQSDVSNELAPTEDVEFSSDY